MQMRWSARRTVAAGTLGLALILAGCVSPAFRESVAQFGTLTKAAAEQQNARLDAVVEAERERIRNDLAQRRALLFGVCEGEIGDEPADETESDASVAATPDAVVALRCDVVGAGGVALEKPATYENIIALNEALTGYGQALVALAADPSEDREALTSGATALGTSIGKLDAAITNAEVGTPAATRQGQRAARLGAVATLLGEVADLYFTARRGAVLRRIIIQSDILIQQATHLLSITDRALYAILISPLVEELDDAGNKVRDLARNNASPAEMRAAQDEVFEVSSRINSLSSAARSSQAIGRSHAALRRAAERGASAADLRAAITALLHLTGTVQATIEAFEEEESNDGGN